jgi:predicted ATPase
LGELLAAAPQLTVLGTSRERLHLYGEQDYPLQPLDLPQTIHPEPLEKLLSYEAIDLFVQRARCALPNLEVSEKELPAIIQICTRLDGLPLALELAASQAKVFSLAVLAAQLEESLEVLPQGPRDMPARQRTLNATIEWSEKLLRPQERTLFTRLAVFSGRATLKAIERVCSTGLGSKIIELLSILVEKHLVLTGESKDGELRFTMLETVHAYASQRLGSSEEAQELQRLHAAYYTEFAEEACRELHSARYVYWSAKLRAEQENLRSVMAWSLGSDDIQYALRLAGALREYWLYNDDQAEGQYWCELILNKEPEAPPDLLAGMLLTAGNLAYDFGDIEASERLLQRSLELYQQAGDQRGAAYASGYLAAISGVISSDDRNQNIEMVRQSLEIFRELGDQPGMALAYNLIGALARLNDYEAAQHSYEESVRFVQLLGDRVSEAIQYRNMGSLTYYRDQYQDSAELIRRAMGTFREFYPAPVYCLINGLAILAGPVARLGDPERAARLLGAVDAGLDLLGVHHDMVDQIDIDKFQISIRQALGAEAFQEAWQAGYEMSIQEALDYALSDH